MLSKAEFGPDVTVGRKGWIILEKNISIEIVRISVKVFQELGGSR
jgi:hypothetical protein